MTLHLHDLVNHKGATIFHPEWEELLHPIPKQSPSLRTVLKSPKRSHDFPGQTRSLALAPQRSAKLSAKWVAFHGSQMTFRIGLKSISTENFTSRTSKKSSGTVCLPRKCHRSHLLGDEDIGSEAYYASLRRWQQCSLSPLMSLSVQNDDSNTKVHSWSPREHSGKGYRETTAIARFVPHGYVHCVYSVRIVWHAITWCLWGYGGILCF